MKIAVGTDDLNTIRSGHFGDSKYYKIFEVEKGKIVNMEIRENIYLKKNNANKHQHGEAKKIVQFLNDCTVFIARSMGMRSVPKLVEKGIHPIITKGTDAEQTIHAFLNGAVNSFLCFNPETKKFIPCTERPN